MVIVEQMGARLVLHELVANSKLVFRGSCEASGSLFRIKKFNFFQNFLLKIQATAHTLLHNHSAG